MVPTLGGEQSASIHREITEHIVKNAQAFHKHDRSRRAVEIRFTGCDTEDIRSWLGTGITYIPQIGGDTGDRTIRALSNAFSHDVAYAIVVNTDCPGLTGQHLEEAFTALHLNDVVIGPSTHGNYYLIGMRKEARLTAIPALFRGIAWGTSFVYGDTLSIIKRLGLSYTVLDTLNEISTTDDIPSWERIKAAHSDTNHQPTISVVIPTLNDASVIDTTLDSISTADNIETIIADGGSSDDTVIHAITRGAHVIESQPARAHQLCTGAHEATGQYLLFVNPGTKLAAGFDNTIRNILADPLAACGTFTLNSDSPRRSKRIIETDTPLCSNMFSVPYNGQGLFFRTGQLDAIDGVCDSTDNVTTNILSRLNTIGKVVIVPGIERSRPPRWFEIGPQRKVYQLILHFAAYITGLFHQFIRSLSGNTDHMPVNG